MIRKLFDTTAFRLSLIYALLFSLVAAIVLAMAYQSAAGQIRQQTDDRLQLETNILLSRYFSGSFEDLNRMVAHRMNKDSTRFFVYSLVSRKQHDFRQDVEPDKKLILGQGESSAEQPVSAAFATLPLSRLGPFIPASHRHLQTRVLITTLPNNTQLLVGSDLSEQQQLLEHITRVLLLAVSIIFAAALGGGALLGYSSLRRIEQIRLKALEIMQGDLSQRMPLRRHRRRRGLSLLQREDEYDRLSHVINNMLDRIEKLMHSTRHVSNNLAHDLRNPLNRLRHRLEAVRAQLPPGEPQQQVGQAVEDVDFLVATFNAILNIAQIEANVQRDHWEVVDVSAMLEELGEMYSVVAEEAGLILNVDIDPGLKLTCDRQLLAQALTNLLDNAIKYTPRGGRIQLRGWSENQRLVLSIADNGPGIAKQDRAKVFEHFTRLDSARSLPGNGLGLSLVQAIMNLHAGSEIKLRDNHPGLIVELIFRLSGE
jgi:signal transduction histidine kinase